MHFIPGCAGSAPIQNIGAYGVEFKDVCDYVDVLNLNTGEQFRLQANECEFGYRESIFKHRYRTRLCDYSSWIEISQKLATVLKYGSLVNFDPQTVTAKQVLMKCAIFAVANLPDPKEFGNAGSFFKNPVVSAEQFV